MKFESFKSFISNENIVLNIANIMFTTPLNESVDNENIYYRKPPQYVMLSKHSREDYKDRMWWKNVNDPNFTNFADECLKILASRYKNRDKNIDWKYKGEVGFYDKTSRYGLMCSLRNSENRERSLDSFSITTILNLDAKSMVKGSKLFTKPDTYTIMLQNFKLINFKEEIDRLMNQLDSLKNEKKDLQNDIEYALMDVEYNPDNKDKQLHLDDLNNTLSNLEEKEKSINDALNTYLKYDSYIVEDITSGRQATIILI